MDFHDRVAIVTAGDSSLAAAACRAFVDAGGRVVLAGAAGSVEAAACDGVDRIVIDLSDSGDVAALVASVAARLGGIDLFLCNEGARGQQAPIISCDVGEFDRVIDGNLKTLFLAMRHALPVMSAQGRGAFVATSSTAALAGLPQLAGYVASNHAAMGLMRGAAMDVAAKGVTVNLLCYGAGSAEGAQGPGEAASTEIAEMALFLASHEARSITGAHFVIDGGQSAALSREIPARVADVAA